jgi:outer membrane PBP1 activator LpoA protein
MAIAPLPEAPAGEKIVMDIQPLAPALPSKAHIALILPLDNKDFAQVAEAVKLGFAAGADADANAATKATAPFRIYACDNDSGALAAEYRKAVAAGAVAVVGGVTRDGASALAKVAGNVPTLALNAPAEADLPDRFFYLSLNIDNEARQQARAAAETGAQRAVILVGTTSLAKRIEDSFEREWLRLGGQVVAKIVLGGDIGIHTRIAATVERARADVAFLAADTSAARAARPYLPPALPVYATSHSLDARAEAVQNVDLEGVRFVEMPWFVEKDHPAVMAYAKPSATLPLDYERLYALGIDAWRLAQAITRTERMREFVPLDGVTGKLVLDGAQFVRTLTPVEMRDGIAQLSRPSP